MLGNSPVAPSEQPSPGPIDLAAAGREAALLDELAVSWESLDALYELNSDLRHLNDTSQLLQRVLDRASLVGLSLAGRPLSVALFERRQGAFVAAMSRCVPQLEQGAEAHWLASVGDPGVTHVFKSAEEVSRFEEAPGYLKSATCLVATPVIRRHGEERILAAWSESAHLNTHVVRLLEAMALHAAMIVEGDRLSATLQAKQRMEHDLEIGAAIQAMLLVEPPPVAPAEYDVSVYTLASQTVDGDFYDFIAHPDGALDVLIGDVMGKGVSAALVGAAAKSALLRALGVSGPAPVAGVVRAASRRLCRKLIELERFVTLCYARLESGRRRLTFVDCGHTGILHYRAATRDCKHLRGTNMPIGFSEADEYEEQTAALAPGDVLLFYSDGVTEGRSAAGDLYGEERLARVLALSAHLGAAAISDAIRADTTAFAGTSAPSDDLTCLVLKIAPLRRLLSLRNDLGELERLRAAVRDFLRDAALPGRAEDFLAAMELALTEAASNIIRHACTGEPQAGFEVTLTLEGHRFCAAIRHCGRPFDPAAAEPPVFDGTRSGGFGLFIIRNLADEIHWDSSSDGFQTMTLIKVYRGET